MARDIGGIASVVVLITVGLLYFFGGTVFGDLWTTDISEMANGELELDKSPVIMGMKNSSIQYLEDNPEEKANDIRIKGKIVILDMTGAKVKNFDFDNVTPPEMKGSFNNLSNGLSDNLTVFCVIKQDQISLGQWKSGGTTKSGYKLNSYIVVFYQPENKIIGWHKVMGSEPPSEILDRTDTITDSVLSGKERTNIPQWINNLPKN